MKKIVIAVLAVFFSACQTDVTTYPFTKSKFYLDDSEGGLVHGQTYAAEFWVASELSNDGIHKEERWLRNTVWKNVVVSCSDDEITVSGNWIRVAPLNLAKLENKTFVFRLSILTNPKPIEPFQIRKAWKAGKTFVAQVAPNEHGPEITVEAAYYDVRATALEGTGSYLLVRQIGTSKLALVRSTEVPILVWAKGGNGRPGADGRSAQLKNGETDAYGERGERGDDGGDGGKVTLLIPNEDRAFKDLFDVNVDGGDGGPGGKGGKGATKDVSIFTALGEMAGGVNRGADGAPGRKGHRGELEWKTVGLETMFVGVDAPGFDRNRLLSRPPTP